MMRCVLPLWIVVLLVLGGCAATGQDSLRVERSANIVPCFGVYEIILKTDEQFANPFWDAAVSGEFTSPTGKTTHVEGFYDGGDEWRIRFVPREKGVWKYRASLRGAQKTVRQERSFTCRGQAGDGFLRVSGRNHHRMEYDTGRPFCGVGIQTCGAIKNVDFDGPTDDGKWRTVSVEEWCNAFAGAVNLVRLNLSGGLKAGCAVPLIPDPEKPDRYNLETCRALDRMYQLHRAAGFSEIAILFQDMSTYGKYFETFGLGQDTRDYKNVHAANMPLQEKYLRYVVNRFGCYVDIWELFNEDSYAPNDYLAHLHKVIREADPYDHIITTNFERPEQDFCEIVAPHEYMNIPASEVDAHLVKQIAAMKSYDKPIQYTEFGNKGTLSNVDPVKWRVTAWTAFMNETGMLYWGMSGNKVKGKELNRGNANAYIGADTRQHFRVLLNFERDLPIDVRPRFSNDSPEFQFRSYTMSNDNISVVYLHRRGESSGMTAPQQFRVRTGPGRFRVKWINPEDGKMVGEEHVLTTVQQFLMLQVPAFAVDLACRIDRTDAPPAVAPAAVSGPAPSEQPAADGWKIAWTADLNNPQSTADWLVNSGELTIGKGVLCLRSAEGADGEITLGARQFAEDVRMEFIGYLSGEDPGDLTMLLNADAAGIGRGYAVQFAGKSRTVTRVMHGTKVIGDERKDVPFEIGRAYRIVVERDGRTIRLFVDGKKILETVDADPVNGRDLDRIGFYTYDGVLCVKDLRVLVKAR